MKTRVPILMFHSVSVAPRAARTPSLYVSPRRFRTYVRILARLGYRGVSMGEHARSPSERDIAFTFDDGYADNVTHALPILREHGFTATCYVATDFIGSWNAWDADLLRVHKRMMTRAQLREWHDAGMEVGAHTRSHCDLTSCEDESDTHDEIAGSKAVLEDVVGSAVSQFSYPYGRHDARATAAVRAAGFSNAVTVREGRARAADDPFALPRLYVGGNYLVPLVLARILTRVGDWRREPSSAPL